MRKYMMLASTAFLAACGGGSEEIASTPTPQPGNQHSFSTPTEAKTYLGVGGVQTYDYLTDERGCCNQQGEAYAGNASTVRNSNISIKYDPRDAIFEVVVNDPAANSSTNVRFQDPANRTDFGGAYEPQWGTPKLANPNVVYLQAGDGNPVSRYSSSGNGLVNPGDNSTPATGQTGSSYQATSFFYLRPGAETKYVTYAGYVRNTFTFETATDNDIPVETINSHLERGAFAYGEATGSTAVPTTGSGTYRGSMLSSVMFNPTLDNQHAQGGSVLPSYFQWMEGSSQLDVNFLDKTFALALSGKLHAPQFDLLTGPNDSVLKEGATFAANGKGAINMVNFGGFRGSFDRASFTNPNGDRHDIQIEGSSIDGAFYGPKAEEAGGGFRIVGGRPDERVDLTGAFIGAK